VLAAGYATRLRPLTDKIAKPLLPLAGSPMLEYLYERIVAVDEIDEVHVVTNSRFAGDFRAWAEASARPVPVRVHDDGTSSNEDRLGAIGDMAFVLERAGLRGEDLLVVAGDNLFDFDLRELVEFWRAKGDGSAICVHDVADPALAAQYSVVELDAQDRVTFLEEKPKRPTSTLAAIAIYLYRGEHAALVQEYLAAGNTPDQPGRFVVWLYPRVPVYGFRFPGEWLDIGDHEQLLEADNRMRLRRGLEPQTTYSLDG
jgi:glucose-1-phosphate thymidylyltransferase